MQKARKIDRHKYRQTKRQDITLFFHLFLQKPILSVAVQFGEFLFLK